MMMGMASCATDTNKINTTISGRFVGSGVDSIFLERISDTFTEPTRVASACLADNGSFSFGLALDEQEPHRFYRISNNKGSEFSFILTDVVQNQLEECNSGV